MKITLLIGKAREKKHRRNCLKPTMISFFCYGKRKNTFIGNLFMSYMGTFRRDLAKLEHEEKETHRGSFQN